MTFSYKSPIYFTATRHVDVKDPEWFRYIHCYVYKLNPTGSRQDQVRNLKDDTKPPTTLNAPASASFRVDPSGWDSYLDCGDYLICLIYWGNDHPWPFTDPWPRADKEIKLHIVQTT